MKLLCTLLISIMIFATNVYADTPISIEPAQSETKQELAKIKQDLLEANDIVIAAGICNLSYGPRTGSKIIDLLEQHNFDVEQYSIKNVLVDSHMILTRYYSNFNNKAIYIVTFRGSSNKKDWNVNFKYGKVPYDNSVNLAADQPTTEDIPLVHNGFNKYVNLSLETKDSVGTPISQLLINDKNADVLVTGHSLGGALAVLYSARLLDMGMEPERLHVITFGSPAVGNKAFANSYAKKMNLVRIVTNQDIIPSALSPVGGYKQFGKQIKLAADPRKFDYFDQHSPGFYFHQTIKYYFDTEAKAISAGVIEAEPLKKIIEGKPLVAIHSSSTPNAKKLMDFRYMPLLLADQLHSLLPSYTTVPVKDPSPNAPVDFTVLPEFIDYSKQEGAKFLLLTQLDIANYKDRDNKSVILNYIIIDLATERIITAASLSSSLKARNSMLQTLLFDISQLPFDIFK